RLAQLAHLNLRLGGFDAPIRQGDLFQTSAEPVDVVVANPPFSVTISDPQILERFDLGRGRARVLSDWLFVEALESWVRPGGRAGIVLPWSILNSPTTLKLRERIDEKWSKVAIVTLPEGVFRPFGGAAGRACMLVLERGGQPGPVRWGAVHDPGYDVRSRYYRPTQSDDVPQLMRKEGWQTLAPGAWTPDAEKVGRCLKDVGSLRRVSVAATELSGVIDVVELADTNRRTGEVAPRSVSAGTLKGRRQRLVAGDVLVSRMRPELGNVVMADRDCVGSPEWIALDIPELPYWVLHALRTPSWRVSLPVTEGQTRPRTSSQAVLDSAVTWPSERTVLAVNATSRALYEHRRALGDGLRRLQEAVDLHAAGELSDQQLHAITGQIHAELDLP
ncbi:MAG: N-6 DNA methylase, partial [Rhodobacterales bacterium]|nr:N-6 DNA methylase [Rhodobacterales bacterium]